MNNALKEEFAKAISLLDKALEANQNSDVKIGDTTISRQEAEEMRSEFELIINNEVHQVDRKLFKIIPIKLAILEDFWRKLQILIREEYSKNL